jgi:hypothetical protein
MENLTYIQNNYKQSTVYRLMERYGYETPESLNIDPDITNTLIFLKEQGLETQKALFAILDYFHEEVEKNIK